MSGELLSSVGKSYALEVLTAMITPALLLTGSSSLAASTSTRLSRVVDRVRQLSAEVESMTRHSSSEPIDNTRLRVIIDQLSRLGRRVVKLRSALTLIYTGIALLLSTGVAIGVTAALSWSFDWPVVILGLCGCASLLGASVQLLGETRLAIHTSLQEMAYVGHLIDQSRQRLEVCSTVGSVELPDDPATVIPGVERGKSNGAARESRTISTETRTG
ncbi:hypothetical protein Isop_1249 [Isosphaera pallida ATCC 43644]|uniref:DUF2721 domain-containing protein n=1 Tax=Isosphaera pallida (strain ATCC 43644 / DSM 9630 / IS1B) TaxID=575540 RepID=E8R6D4_ISOPI|nr:DUF2721 domain-containing protein [Isosphaera pallida]ADV61835.1 hypothetical protein Isop_1249 [Isosphaera pallida ATCC 43644]